MDSIATNSVSSNDPSVKTKGSSSKDGHVISATEVTFHDGTMMLELSDGRVVHVPLRDFPRLATATKHQLTNYRWIGSGRGIHWPHLNEDLSVEGLIRRYG